LFTIAGICQPTTGLVAYFPMDGNFNDAGPYNIAGTNVGSCLPTTNIFGQPNKAMAFSNPTNTVVQYGTHAINGNVNFSGAQDFTYSFSLYLSSPYVHSGGVYDNNLNYGGPGIWFWNSPGYLALQFNYKNASVASLNGTMILGGWMKIICMRASGVLKIYINAVLVNTTNEGTMVPTYNYTAKFGTMWYQAQTPPPYNGHNGKIDEFRIYNRALTQQEITDLYVLPISLSSFSAIKSNSNVALNWQTSTEQNCDHFNLQRSTDGVNFTTIGQVRANGNSSTSINYQYTDQTAKDIAGGKTIFYRLEIIDFDARKTYSSVVTIKLDSNKDGLLILQNPVVNDLRMQVSSAEKKNASFIITDPQGRQVVKRDILLYQGSNAITISLSGLTRGIYYVTMIAGEIKQTKSLLMQ
ncbi:MAG TPA: LamG-like jellyroll fold domain-containing protein, partial [Ferruginibacter sp.]|nr:LamG-like jellyroll fold domain-containing protein [Ferruginibacter sp.]